MFFVDRFLPSPKAKIRQTDNRSVRAVVARPNVMFYDPEALNYGNAQLPIVPDNGGAVTMGCQMVEYRDGNVWNRGDVSMAGPVKKFFRNMMADTSVKQS